LQKKIRDISLSVFIKNILSVIPHSYFVICLVNLKEKDKLSCLAAKYMQ